MTALERAHRATIATTRPGEPDDLQAYRVKLAVLRDNAAIAIDRAGPEASPILQHVASHAGLAVYAPWSAKKLFAIHSALELTMMAARSIEWAARADG